MKALIKGFLDLLFARRCLSCGKVNPKGSFLYLCEDCAETLDLNLNARCLRCCEPLIGSAIDSTDTCVKCFGTKFYFEKGWCACLYKGVACELAKELKYRKGLYVLPDIAKIFAQNSGYFEFVDNAFLVPVPLHRKRLQKRGYNQSRKIAEILAKQNPSISGVLDLLVRVKDTPTQTMLDRQNRVQNVKNAFAVKESAVCDKNIKLVLLDDVMTTGATLNECAKTLKKAGYKNVSAMCFAKRPL
ncbi:MAG: ComF family protein [Opitutales bacterium]|nr:ComF family protein [Opitutales bacterium]